MTAIRRLVQRDPSGVLTVVNLIAGAVAAALGRPELSGVLVVVAGLILGLRTQVTPVAKAAEQTNRAAATAALEVARNLTDGTAGAAGEISGAAAPSRPPALRRSSCS